MRTNTLLNWGLAATLLFGVMTPGWADKYTNPGHGDAARVRITVIDKNDDDDVRAFQAWYGVQMRDYDRIDPETGERIADLAQMVVEISDGKLLVTDQSNLRRGVLINARTRITLANTAVATADDNTKYFGLRKPTEYSAKRLSEIFHVGDMVIAEGYLRVNGGISATSIRIVGRARGYGYDDDRDGRDRYGYRTWGAVQKVDARRGKIEIDGPDGRRTVSLERNGNVLANGRTESLDYLHRGDRVVVYSKDGGRRDDEIRAYRIVILQANDRYPDGDGPCSADPDYRNDRATGPMLEGRLQSITTSIFFNKMVISGNNGLNYSVRFSKTIEATDRNGNRVSPLNLRTNERLRIYYADVAGNLFAERIEIQ